MAKYKYKTGQMIAAIMNAEGNLTRAAESLGCARGTVYKYINDFPTVKATFEEVNERTIDYVEDQLMTQVRRGNMTAIIFFLKTRAKHRGYIERQEFQHEGKVTIVNWDDTNNSTD